MLECVLKTEHLEIQMDSSHQIILLKVENGEKTPVTLHLNQTALFELMHTFLSINRTFNKEKAYFMD